MHATSIKGVFREFCFSPDLEILIPDQEDKVVCAPGFSAVYVAQLRVGLRLPPFPLMVSLLRHYKFPLAQLVPNGIRIIIAFKLYCRANMIDNLVDLFHLFFVIKCSPMKGLIQFFSSSSLEGPHFY